MWKTLIFNELVTKPLAPRVWFYRHGPRLYSSYLGPDLFHVIVVCVPTSLTPEFSARVQVFNLMI